AAQELVLLAVLAEALAATVRRLSAGLKQEQAALRGGGENAATAGLVRDGGVGKFRVKAEERELEPVLSAGLAMASACVEAEFGGDRVEVGGEMDNVVRDRAGGYCRQRREDKPA